MSDHPSGADKKIAARSLGEEHMKTRVRPDPVKPAPLPPVVLPNVTPLLGVLIVLLVSYMVSLSPQQMFDVRLPTEPRVALRPEFSHCDSDVTLEYRPDGALWVNNQDVDRDHLAQRLRAIFDGRRHCNHIFIRAAPNVPYGAVAEIVDVVKGAGVQEVIMLGDRR